MTPVDNLVISGAFVWILLLCTLFLVIAGIEHKIVWALLPFALAVLYLWVDIFVDAIRAII